MCLESLLKQEPTRLMIEALEPTIGWEINKLEMDALASKSTEIALLYRKILNSH